MSNMRLKINNIGPINEADINLGKLNIVGGVNGSGKSTSSKLLYSFLLAASPESDEIYDNIIKGDVHSTGYFLSSGICVQNDQKHISSAKDGGHFELTEEEKEKLNAIGDKIEEDFKRDCQTIRNLLQLWYDMVDSLDINCKDFYYNHLNKLYNKAHSDFKRKFLNVVLSNFSSEFDYPPFDDTYGIGTACFSGKNEDGEEYKWTLYVGEDKSDEMESEINMDSVFSGNVHYLDSVSTLEIIDIGAYINLPRHFQSLREKFGVEKTEEDFNQEFDFKLNKYKDELNNILNGKFRYGSDNDVNEDKVIFTNEEGFIFERNNIKLPLKNISSGSKQIGSIRLILDKIVGENDFLIIDEPEVNLHPEWQIELAEFIVKLVKELNINVYINSHGPQFIEALEVFSVKYGIDDETHFYMTVKNEENDKFDFKEIYYSNISEFYQMLAKPYEIINEVRLENNLKDL